MILVCLFHWRSKALWPMPLALISAFPQAPLWSPHCQPVNHIVPMYQSVFSSHVVRIWLTENALASKFNYGAVVHSGSRVVDTQSVGTVTNPRDSDWPQQYFHSSVLAHNGGQILHYRRSTPASYVHRGKKGSEPICIYMATCPSSPEDHLQVKIKIKLAITPCRALSYW